MSFERNLRFGVAGEGAVARWLRSRGHAVLPAYEKCENDHKGPRIFYPHGEYVAPDLLVWKGAHAFWIEAKRKTGFTFHRITQRMTTGIDLHHYLDYCKIDDSSPWPVWLLFVQDNLYAKDTDNQPPPGIYGNSLSYLREHENHRSDKFGRHGMVYWAIEHLKHVA